MLSSSLKQNITLTHPSLGSERVHVHDEECGRGEEYGHGEVCVLDVKYWQVEV